MWHNTLCSKIRARSEFGHEFPSYEVRARVRSRHSLFSHSHSSVPPVHPPLPPKCFPFLSTGGIAKWKEPIGRRETRMSCHASSGDENPKRELDPLDQVRTLWIRQPPSGPAQPFSREG